MNEQKVRIGFIGAGGNTKLRHIPGFQTINGVELVSVANRTLESGQKIADEFGILKVYDDWTDLIKSPEIDAICVGTWPYMHRTLVLAALENNKHVLTEARMAMNAQEARDMLNASRCKPNLITQVVPAPFTFPVDQTLREMIQDGYLGDLLSVDLTACDMSLLGGFLDPEAPMRWRHDRDLSGYNMMLMGGWYEVLLRWAGCAISVKAITRVNVTSRLDASGQRREISIPDHVEILAEMASGAVCHMRVSEVTGFVSTDKIWLYGTKGTILVESDVSGDNAKVFAAKKNDTELRQVDIDPNKRGFWRVEEEFINAIRGLEDVSHTTFEDGVRYMEFTEAVTRSSQTGNTVDLPL